MLTVELNGVDGLVGAVEVGQDVLEFVSDRVQVRAVNFAVVVLDEMFDVFLAKVKQSGGGSVRGRINGQPVHLKKKISVL